MSIVRVVHDKHNPYVILNKESLWDKKLSLRACGMWARLISRPDNWRIIVDELAASCGLNRKTIYSILNELIDAGYVFRFQKRGARGRVCSIEYFVFESPASVEEFKKSLPVSVLWNAGKRDAVSGDAVTPYEDSQALTNIDITNPSSSLRSEEVKEKREEDKPPPPASFCYKRVKMGKEKLEKLFDDFGKEKVEKMLDRLDEYADINPKRFKQYACHAAVIRKWMREDGEKKAAVTPTDQSSKLLEFVKVHYDGWRTGIVGIDVFRDRIEYFHGPSVTAVKLIDSSFSEQTLNMLRKFGLKGPLQA